MADSLELHVLTPQRKICVETVSQVVAQGAERDAEPTDPPERALGAARALCARRREAGTLHALSIDAGGANFR